MCRVLSLSLVTAVACNAPDSPGAGTNAPDDPRGPDAGVVVDGDVPDGGTTVRPRVIYPANRRHSPLTDEIVARIGDIMLNAAGAERVFAKVGDSMTHAPEFLRCFDGGTVDLADRAGLQPAIDFFMMGNADGSSPYARVSIAAYNGATGATMLEGSPSPLASELAAIQPRLGVVMLGTNDVRRGRALADAWRDLWEISDRMLAARALPLLSSIPANTGDAWADVQIPRFNLGVRGIAQGRQVPFVDLHRALNALPGRGIGPDGVHLSVAPQGACVWTADGLQYGYNTRNLVSIEMLNRVRAAIAGDASDTSADYVVGAGLAADPYIASYPFADLGDTRGGQAVAGSHGCTGTTVAPQPGNEVVYRVDLPAQVRLHAQVITRGATNVDVHVITDGTCRGSGADEVIATVGPGPVDIIVDTPAVGAEGEFLLVVGPRVNPP